MELVNEIDLEISNEKNKLSVIKDKMNLQNTRSQLSKY